MTSPTTNTPNSMSPPHKVSYAQATQHIQVPTKEQAIIIDAIEGVSVQEYARELAKIISPTNMKFISRISFGRVCIYLSSKEIADRLTDNHTKINIGGQQLEIRPLISKAKRIILSNACPIIPNETILEELTRLNITPVSKITYIRAGINDSGFTHLLSFRRQMYIKPEDVATLPPVLRINFDDTTYFIYLSTEKVTCFICNEEGHLAKHCKKSTESQYENTSQMENNNNRHADSSIIDTLTAPAEENNPTGLTTMLPPLLSNKRPPSKSLSSISNISGASRQGTESEFKIIKKDAKKAKIIPTQSINLDEVLSQLEPTRNYFTSNADTLTLNFEEIAKFLQETHGQRNIQDIASKYTDDFSSLCTILSDINHVITESKLRHRIIRIKKRLENCNTEETSSQGSSISEDLHVN